MELLILQSKGKLSLYDSPIKYIPELKKSKEITREMLASQLSGLTRDSIAETFHDGPVSDGGPMRLCSEDDPECTPPEFFKALGDEVPLFAPQTQIACIFPSMLN